MASIYDSYQIAQSQKARPYIGNSLSELRDLGNEMQRRYDTTLATMDNIDMLSRQVATDPKSKAALDETLAGVRNRLQEYASRPDKENLIRPTSILARDFAADAQTFMNNLKSIQDFNEEVDKNDKLDATTKERIKNLEYTLYSGLKRDPNTGRLVNTFKPQLTPAEAIDAPELVNKIIQGIQSNKGGTVRRDIQGNYYVERGSSVEQVTPEEVTSIANNIINTDPKVQAHLNFQGQLTGLENSLSIHNLDQITNPKLREKISQEVGRTGKPVQKVIYDMFGTNRVNEIRKGLIEAAVGKAAFKKTSSEYKIMGETEEATRAAQEPLRFMVAAPSNVATGELQNMNSSDLEARIQDTDKSIASQRQQLAALIRNGAPASDIQTARNQLSSLEDQKLAGQSVLENTRNEAARRMGFKDYQDYIARDVAGKVQSMVKGLPTDVRGNVSNVPAQAYDASGRPIPGRGITKDQLREALQNNSIHFVDAGTGIPGDSYYEVPVNGGTVRIREGSGDDTFSMLRYNVQKDVRGGFEKQVKELFKDSKNLNYTTHQINIGEKDGTEVLSNMYSADPNAFTVYDRSGKRISDQDDLPQNLKFSSINVVKGGNGSVMLQGYTEKKDKKGNVEEREYYTIVPNPNNNVGSVLGARILKDAQKMTSPRDKSELTKAGVTLMGDSWDGILSNSALNENIPIRNTFGSTLGYIRKERNQANPKSVVYRIYNSNGQPAYRRGTNGMLSDISTNDITDAANLIRGIVQNSDKAQAQQQ